MKFTQFLNNLYSTITDCDVNHHTSCYGRTIVESVDNKIFINNELTHYKSLEEAKQHIKNELIQESVYQEIQEDIYYNLSYNTVANIIKEHSDIKITNTLIESYVDLASAKSLTTDSIVQSIRRLNKLDHLIEGKLDYTLNDGSVVIISPELQEKINILFDMHQDVIEYMNEDRDNFLDVINQLETCNGCN